MPISIFVSWSRQWANTSTIFSIRKGKNLFFPITQLTSPRRKRTSVSPTLVSAGPCYKVCILDLTALLQSHIGVGWRSINHIMTISGDSTMRKTQAPVYIRNQSGGKPWPSRLTSGECPGNWSLENWFLVWWQRPCSLPVTPIRFLFACFFHTLITFVPWGDQFSWLVAWKERKREKKDTSRG